MQTNWMLIGTSAYLRAADNILEIVVAGANLKPVAIIKSLGVILDSHLTFAAHVTAVCKACNYHIWVLRHIRYLLTHDVANILACSIVGAHMPLKWLFAMLRRYRNRRFYYYYYYYYIDYCNITHIATQSCTVHQRRRLSSSAEFVGSCGAAAIETNSSGATSAVTSLSAC